MGQRLSSDPPLVKKRFLTPFLPVTPFLPEWITQLHGIADQPAHFREL